ncbi:SDR family oxidoreductase [Enemella sp. A6]|uniref:SDR family oxidoreductase n=1 Tax=Enemella sp. A6 TaxID=3440152 RepID=UPI003EBF98A0
MPGTLEGLTAVVSGVGPGLGRAVALDLGRHGCNLVLVARRMTFLEQVREELGALGREAVCVSADVTDPDACAHVAATAEQHFGRGDILVNNAFLSGPRTTVLDSDFDQWRSVIEVNLFGTLNMTRAMVPLLSRHGDGRVVMVNSLQAWKVIDGFAAYSTSKAALSGVTRTLAQELGGQGIRVNAVHPGMIWSEQVEGYLRLRAEQSGRSYQDVHAEACRNTALGYIPGPEEMAGTITYLASPLARPVTGQSIGTNAGEWFH